MIGRQNNDQASLFQIENTDFFHSIDPNLTSARWRANSGTWIQNDSDVAQGPAGASATG
jgi:hypothetical protein